MIIVNFNLGADWFELSLWGAPQTDDDVFEKYMASKARYEGYALLQAKLMHVKPLSSFDQKYYLKCLLWFKLNPINGATWYDVSGSGFHAQYVGTVAKVASFGGVFSAC